MAKRIETAGVIGAGVMGAAIAAHLTNVGIETVLLDIVPPELTLKDTQKGLTTESKEFRNKLSQDSLHRALHSKPASFYLSENADLITIGNLEDNVGWLGNVDLIVEAVVERLEIKQRVFDIIEANLTLGTIITSNTSGISARDLCDGRSDKFRKHFAITHFFNPPRYMKLLEIVPGPDTIPEVLELLGEFGEKQAGKGVIYAKDTPNFVANRIGVYSMLCSMQAMIELGLSIEAVDKLTGPVIGRPKSASFRTADLVGLDIMVQVADNVYKGAPDDEERNVFKPPDFINKMIERGLLGEKTGKGFYQKTTDPQGNRLILSLDYKTLDYTPQEKVRMDSLNAAEMMTTIPQKIKSLYYADDAAGQFTFRTLTETLLYAANRVPEIAEDIIQIDNAMKWGFGWEIGPFEIWDSLDVARSVDKMTAAGHKIPYSVQEMLSKGYKSFYIRDSGIVHYYNLQKKEYNELSVKPNIILLASLKDRKKEIAANPGASLVDLEDGVACLEFHTKMNAIGEDIVNMIFQSADRVSRDFEGLVIANHADNFSAGANLPLILFTAQEGEWDELDSMIKLFQDALMRLKYLEKPVVAAPAGQTLGGGCEICLAADRVRFAAETYLGLVEVGVGLLPAGGGTKELLIRNTENLFEVKNGGIYPKQIELMPFVARAFETIALGKVSTSGPEAIEIGYLRRNDRMTVNRDYLINDAKDTVISMKIEGYTRPRMKTDIRVAGENTLAMIELALWTVHKQDMITEHDVTVSKKVAYVLCGGELDAYTTVSEQYLLDLEREAFLSLCGDPKTQARIQHMLMTGKPLRN